MYTVNFKRLNSDISRANSKGKFSRIITIPRDLKFFIILGDLKRSYRRNCVSRRTPGKFGAFRIHLSPLRSSYGVQVHTPRALLYHPRLSRERGERTLKCRAFFFSQRALIHTSREIESTLANTQGEHGGETHDSRRANISALFLVLFIAIARYLA